MLETIFVLGFTVFIAHKIMGGSDSNKSGYSNGSHYDYDCDSNYEYDYEYEYDCESDNYNGGSSYRGCCSHHGGIDDVCDSGVIFCNDGSVSPSS